MTNLHNDSQNNLVSFLRHNRPIPPQPSPNLEQSIMNSLEDRRGKERKRHLKITWNLPSAIATGVLFTTVSFGIKTPRIAIEPKDLENFLVNNWQDTIDRSSFIVVDDHEVNWLLPSVSESEQAVSISVK